MSDSDRIKEFLGGLARLISETGVELSADGCDVQLSDRITGRYLGILDIEDDMVRFTISPYDDAPELEVQIKENENES